MERPSGADPPSAEEAGSGVSRRRQWCRYEPFPDGGICYRRLDTATAESAEPLALGCRLSILQVGSGDRKHHEPEYEEVGPPTGLRKNTDNGTKGDGFHCDLCGSAPAAVRCDRCGSQTFCLSCDDMYHRHPRRSSHVRKAVDSKAPSGGGVRPPLPPKGDSQGAPPPQPPPRKNKRSGFGFSKKDQSAASESVSGAGRTIMGSLKKFMGARPLPPTPDQMKAAAKNDSRDAPPSKALIRASTSPSLPNLSDQTNDDIRAGLPQSILELNRSRPPPKNSTSTPATPASPNAQYPPLQPKTQQPHAHTHSLGRKFSLQQLPQAGMEDKRAVGGRLSGFALGVLLSLHLLAPSLCCLFSLK
ncbi:hypothetical protein C7M84_013611 [Penaeus vannamei]|uniref:Uncharacterized protein n=1 Tax=Penaeus vannamei TaxID=6689 RepID=A0A423SVL7_PENVA|nr:hypothetical protein C7M84_013611 [Penaeus vannamei]